MQGISTTNIAEQSQMELNDSMDPLKTCSICLFAHPQSNFLSVGCQHKFCQSCLQCHVEEQFQQYQLIRCPQQNCLQVIDHSRGSIYHLLGNKQKRKIDTILSNFSRMLNVKNCMKCKEGQLIESLEEEKPIYFCDHCHERHCYNCCRPVHKGRTSCTAEEQAELPENSQQCRKCLTIVEKTMGCSHIRCLCGFDFCFECGYHWDQSHICEYKLARRQGLSQACCCFAKVITLFLVFLAAIAFVVLAVLSVCVLSSLLGGVIIWSKIVNGWFPSISSGRVREAGDTSSGDNQSPAVNQCWQLFLFFLAMMLFPIVFIGMGMVGFIIPFVNLCYSRKIILRPTIINEIFDEVERWFYLLLMI